MICMFLMVIHFLCIAFGFEGIVEDVISLFMAGYLEIGLIDLPIILFSGTKKEWF